VKPGLLIKRKTIPSGAYQYQLFEDVDGDWHGVVINFVPHHKAHRPTKYNFIEVLLSSHGGIIRKSWLSDAEIADDIEVLQ